MSSARLVVIQRLHETIETFLRLHGLPVDQYVVVGHAARWLHGNEQVLGIVSLYVPGLLCEQTDLYGFYIEILPPRECLDAKYAVRVSLYGLNVEP